MSIQTFKLPDLGEGLPEAEIVNWHVKVGDSIKVDEPMVSVETAKAVVEVPSPFNGVVTKLYGGEGDLIKTHAELIDVNVGSDVSGDTTLPKSDNQANDPVVAAIDQLEGMVEEQESKQAQMELAPAVATDATSSNQSGLVTFFLPDLGEGLPEAEIVSWHVNEGDSVSVDQTMVSVETAKAVVEVPSPHTGVIAKLYAGEGDVVKTHAALVDFLVEGASTQAAAPAPTKTETAEEEEDSGTVVGKMQSSDTVLVENVRIGSKRRRDRKNIHSGATTASSSTPSVSIQGNFKALPSVRLAAKEQGIDLSQVPATGKLGQVTKDDLRAFASRPSEVMAPSSGGSASMLPAAGLLQRPASETNFGVAERLRGPRRAMNHSMSASRDQVSQCTLFDDADIHYWVPGQDITGRILRALVAGCFAAPELNAWFDQNEATVTKHKHVDVAMAVDTPNGLIVPVLRGVEGKSQQAIRADLNHIKVATRERTVSPADMANPTITLSNFGMMAGRYATPVLVPPMVTIIGTGGIRHDVVAVLGGIEVHKRVPLSLTFDHRCITGGEACRFLAAMIKDLEKPF